MNRRQERINSLVRNTIGELLLSKLSDPRIDPARTSVTHVEVAQDILSAKVFISVMGTEGEQARTVQALQHAAGHIQELMMRQIELRTTPKLIFELDKQFKKTLETLVVLQRVADELRQKEESRHEAGGEQETEEGPRKSEEV